MFKRNFFIKQLVLCYKNYSMYIILFLLQTILSIIIMCLPFFKYNFELFVINFLTIYYIFTIYKFFYKKLFFYTNNNLLLNIYLNLLYLISNYSNYGYIYNLLKYNTNIMCYYIIQITKLLSLSLNIKHFWYPLFKKYSYFGYSRFTRFTKNRFYRG